MLEIKGIKNKENQKYVENLCMKAMPMNLGKKK